MSIVQFKNKEVIYERKQNLQKLLFFVFVSIFSKSNQYYLPFLSINVTFSP